MRRLIERVVRCRRGTAIVEFAILLPVLACLLIGLLAYGRYFLLAHSAQQVANDAARATVAGLNDDERRDLAVASVANDVATLGEVSPNRVSTGFSDTAGTVSVTVTVDATGLLLFRTPIVPLPSPVIVRRAVTHIGGLS